MFCIQKKNLYISSFLTIFVLIATILVPAFSKNAPPERDENCSNCILRPREFTIQYIQKNSNFPSSVKIKLSYDNKQWKETTVNHKKPLSFECHGLKYIMVETKIKNHPKKALYELACLSSYDIFWNSQKDMWDVRLVRSIR